MGDGLGSLILGFIGLLIFGAAWLRVTRAPDTPAAMRALRSAATVTVILAALIWLGSLYRYSERQGVSMAATTTTLAD